ncbi:hypothetical protein BC941DRAFT_410734 [Chlamydoabsidia padenii]|nr:hypothetical protein BC941DRAFT_410734 [Chlamydoabsidia padenii]
MSTMRTSYAQSSDYIVSSSQIPTSPIGNFFNDQDDLEMDTDLRSIDTPAPVKFVRQDSIRMRQAAPIATPSTAVIENLLPFNHLQLTGTQASPPPTNQSLSPGQQSTSPPLHHHHQRKQQTTTQNPTEAMVQSGIRYHEAGQLEKATDCFRQAAARDSPMGMFLYGVSLRHGWGCKKSEHLAFQYLQKAAEHAVLDLNSLSSTVNTSASKGELIMAIYEMGVSFRHGWGCKKNKETAVHFFKIAADLGDPDAQNDLGHCYHHGNGVKKDLRLAAKYYRLADKQGHGLMGNSWIWKPKYD